VEIPNRLLIGLLIFGILVPLIFWGLGLVPWWAALLIVVAAPIGVFAVIILLFYALWIASGSH
jgi:hypothetical protein